MRSYLRVRVRLDQVVAVPLLVVLSPVLALALLFVVLADGRPAIYRDCRLDATGGEFQLYKVRTFRRSHRQAAVVRRPDGSYPEVGASSDLVSGARLLRRTGIDELPQLVNIVRGQMAFIGPRPLPCDLGAVQRQRLPARPGVLGLAQVRGRRALPLGERIALDNEYARSASLWLDLRILGAAVRTIVRGTE
jgi:undecaprenyl phosphate N,N'-diacetylbacillosamine 1-phosphate transferase